MAHVSHKLSTSVEGALAGGGDPATSPLYVFGPFLRLIVVAGVASVTFGTSIWMVVFTIAMVSAMYRLVMQWVTDGSGGSGLSEEEFGGWAVKVNAAITFIEYTLTFLVSMAAMVTFIADRFPLLNDSILGIQYRTIVAIVLSVATGWLVNRGPRTAARAFGPATAGVLALLWAMIIATILKYGFQLPEFNFQAYSPEYLKFTFGGFTRMLAVMTGIEVFANLVAAYDGPPAKKSKKAFGSLMIIMGTTIATMLIVGPAIYKISEPSNEHVSVFTQTMDVLLPQPLAYLGTLIGIAVLLSASAASAQGLQNLALGLKDRRYIPAFMGERNEYDVADKPVWLEVGLVTLIFLIAGTNEETYLALYAAGVFILLSMTGWAAAKRLVREIRKEFVPSQMLVLIGTAIAAAITSAATVVIFEERFFEGAWMYFIFVPALYAGFTYVRNVLGAPSPAADRIGGLQEAMQPGFGFGQAIDRPALRLATVGVQVGTNPSAHNPVEYNVPLTEMAKVSPPGHILVPLDGTNFAEQALPAAEMLSKAYDAIITLATVIQEPHRGLRIPGIYDPEKRYSEKRSSAKKYLQDTVKRLEASGLSVNFTVLTGDSIAETLNSYASGNDIDMLVISTHGRSGIDRWFYGSIANRIIQLILKPVLIMRPQREGTPPPPEFKRLLVTLDGSEFSERVLPWVRASTTLGSQVLLLRVPEVPEAGRFGGMVEEIQELREEAEHKAYGYLNCIAKELEEDGISTRVLIEGSRPAKTIVRIADEERVDVILLATHGRGGLDRLFMGSVADRVVRSSRCPVFLVPIHERRANNNQST